MEVLVANVVALVSVIAAILAWVAKIRWSNEFREAKEAQIETLRERVRIMESLNPTGIRAHYGASRLEAIRLARLALIPLMLAVVGCASTPFGSMPVPELSDEQLILELEAAARGVGVEIDRFEYLLATRPDPLYVLTSSRTQAFGLVNAHTNAFIVPTAYGARISAQTQGSFLATSTTQYQYTDANAFARGMNDLAAGIVAHRQRQYRARAEAVLTEIRTRIAERERAIQDLITAFLVRNPDLRSRVNALAMVTPWVAAEYPDFTPSETLEFAGAVLHVIPQGGDLRGWWHGIFTQTTTSTDGSVVTFSNFVQVFLEPEGDGFTGSGMLGSGEEVALSVVSDRAGRLTGTLSNRSSLINVSFEGVFASDQVTTQFGGGGVGQSVTGTAVFLR